MIKCAERVKLCDCGQALSLRLRCEAKENVVEEMELGWRLYSSSMVSIKICIGWDDESTKKIPSDKSSIPNVKSLRVPALGPSLEFKTPGLFGPIKHIMWMV